MALNLEQLAELMREIDTCLLCTTTEGGVPAARPMSNNRQVAYDGTNWFFTWEKSRMARDVQRDSKVMVTYSGNPGLWVAVQGDAQLVDDRDTLAKHWDPELERWFGQGIDTPGITLIKVTATRITYWTYEHGDGEILP